MVPVVKDRHAARAPAPAIPVRRNLSCARRRARTARVWSLTELSNVVAYACLDSRTEDRPMATTGQPTLYKPDYCERAHNYCPRGATTRRRPPARAQCGRRQNEGAERAETSNPSEITAFSMLARRGGNRRKLAKTPRRNFARETVGVFLSHPRGAVQGSIPTSLAEIAEIPRSRRQRHRGGAAAIVAP